MESERRAGGGPAGSNRVSTRHDDSWATAFRYVRVSPDGHKLALADRRTVVVMDQAGNKTKLSSGWQDMIRILVTPDGRSYCHDYVRMVSELFIVEGLK